MSGTQLNTELRLTANNSDLLQKNAQVKASNAEIGASAKKAGADATAGMQQAVAATQGLANSAVNARNIIATLGPATSTASAQVVSSNAASAASFDTIAASAQLSAARTVASIDGMTASYVAFQAEAAVVQSFMATEAKSLDDVIERRLAYQEALQAGIVTQEEFAAANAALVKQEAALLAASDKHVASVASLVQKYTGAAPAVEKLAADEAILNNALKQGTISAEAHSAAMLAIANKRSALTEVASDAAAASGAMGKLQFETAGVTQEVSRLGSEVLRGNFQRMEGSAIVLAQRAGLLSLAFSGVGAAIVGVIAVLGTAITLFVASQNEIDGFNRALVLTGNYSNTTSQQLAQLTSKVGEQTGHYGDAQEALTKLAASGKIAGDQMEAAARGSIEFGELTGEAVDKTVDVFEKLATDPVKTLTELNDRMHFLSAAQLEEVASLESVGDKTDAARVATTLFVNVLDERIGAYKIGLSGIVSAWNDVKKGIGGAIDEAKAFFAIGPTNNSFTGFFANLFGGADAASAGFAARDQNTGAVDAAAKNAAALKVQAQAVQDFANQFVAANQKELEALNRENETFGQGKLGLAQYETQKEIAAAQARFHGEALAQETALIKAQRAPIEVAAAAIDKAAASKKADAAAARQAAADQRTLLQTVAEQDKAYADLDEIIRANTTGLAGPYAAAYNQHEATLKKINDDLAVFQKQGPVNNDIWDKYTQAVAANDAALDANNARIKEQHDLMTQADRDLQDQIALWNVAPESQAAVTDGLRQYDSLLKSHYDFYGNYIADDAKLKAELDKQLPSYIATRQAIDDVSAAQKANEQINQEWISIVSNGLDSFGNSLAQFVTGGIKNWHSFWQSLLGDATQFIAAIIQQMLKLTAFNGIVNNLFGLSGSSALPTGLGNGLLGQLFGGASGGSSTGSGFNLFSADSWVDAGKNLWSGFFGGNATNAVDANGVLQYQPNSGASIANGGYSSGFGQALGVAGGVYAGYNEYKSAGGGAGGLLGGAAYGAGTYALGAGISSVLAGGSFAAGVGGAFAVPFIGWAALVAMVVDKVSGGKLFGTAYQTIGATTAINVGPDGASADVQLQQSKESALFGGKKYRDKTGTVTPEMQDAANQLQDAFTQLVDGAAKTLAIETPDLLAESLKTVQTFDKKGNVTSTAYTTDVNGQTFTDATAELQQTRAAAEQLINVVAHSDIGSAAETIAEQWRSSADTLMDGAQLLIASTADIENGIGLLGKDGTLADTVAVVQKLQGADETLLATYVRLQTETQTVSTILDNLGLTTSKTGADFVQFSDDMVKAAGGLDNLNTLWNDYFNNYYSDSERAAAKLKTDQANEQKLFATIGQDPNESMADFRTAFTAVFDTLSPEDVVKWLQAGDALAAVNADLGTTADVAAQVKAQYESFIQPFRDAVAGVTDFEAAVRGMGGSLNDAISQANALAQAQGLQGASAGDIAAIIQSFSIQGANALAQFQQQTQAIASKLYGADYLQGLLDDYKKTGNVFDIQKITDAQGAQVKQQDNSRYLDAYQLANNAAQIAAFSGGNVEDILKSMGVPLGALASDLKLQGTSLEDYLGKLVDQAKINEGILDASDITNKLLQDILDQARGAPLTYTKPSDFGFADPATAQQAVSTGKPNGRGTPGPVTVTPQPVGTAPSTPPASSGGGGDGDDVGKAVGRVGDAVDGAAKAITANGEDVKTAMLPILTAINALTAAINRSRLVQPTPSLALSRN